MTPQQIPLARRIIACGLPTPAFTACEGGGVSTWPTFETHEWEVELSAGDTCRPFGAAAPTGLLFACVATDTGAELLPVLEDFALYGWLVQKLRANYGRLSRTTPNTHEPADHLWSTFDAEGDKITSAKTEVEALVAALEATKGAA